MNVSLLFVRLGRRLAFYIWERMQPGHDKDFPVFFPISPLSFYE
jgi:hypothetical protein